VQTPDTGMKLVLPRAALELQLHHASQAFAAVPTMPHWVVYGVAVLQRGWAGCQVLAGPWHRHEAVAVSERLQLNGPSLLTACLVVMSDDLEGDPHWERWWRVAHPGATNAPASALVLVVCRTGGTRAALRIDNSDWFEVEHLSMPGPGSGLSDVPSRIALRKATAGGVVQRFQGRGLEPKGDSDQSPKPRHAPFSGRSFAVVGMNRLGAMVAHGLARMGAHRLVLFDQAKVRAEDTDGDLLLEHEGRSRAQAVARYVRPGLRPGAMVDARHMPMACPLAGAMLMEVDTLLICEDIDDAALWGSAFALAMHKNLLWVSASTSCGVAQADLLWRPAGGTQGCPLCWGRLSTRRRQQPATEPHRAWSGLCASIGLRMLELEPWPMMTHPMIRHVRETTIGGLDVQDWSPRSASSERLLKQGAQVSACPLCAMAGTSLVAVTESALSAALRQWGGESDASIRSH
jgi:hypothetical protein